MKPDSIAVVGASAEPSKTAGRPIAFLQKIGFRGRIFPVNPRADIIAGLQSYEDVHAIPEVPDVGIVLLGAERAHLAVRDLAARGTAAAIVLASGYAETGPAGEALQQQLIEAAGSMRLLGPNTIGLINVTDNIPLSASGALEGEQVPAGPIALISQSGGILGALLSHAAARGIGFSKLVSTSNEADLKVSDFIDYLADDEATGVIAVYLESIRDVGRFRAAASKAAAAGKPIVAFKVGRSEAGSQAVVSHTGALSGADRMYDALFEQLGIIRASRYSDLLDISLALASGRPLKGRRLAILTSTGGAGSLVSDSLGVAGFETPAPDAQTAARLRALETGSHAVLDRNPIDVTLAGLQPSILEGAIGAVLDSPSYDGLVVVVGSSSLAQPNLVANAIRNSMAHSEKPILAYVSPHAPMVGRALVASGIPAFSAPESCAAALAAMANVGRWSEPEPPHGLPSVDIAQFGSGKLDEEQSKRLFSAFGVPSVPEQVVSSGEEAVAAALAMGGRLVLKILSRDIAHKSELGGVAVDLAPGELADRMKIMADEVEAKAGVRPDRFLVQKYVKGGVELILGLSRDPLGLGLLLGAGGTAAELLGDTALILLPEGRGLSRDDAMALVRSLKTFPLLDGFRGRPAADVAAVVSAIVGFSQMAAQMGDALLEAEINPLLVMPAGRGVFAADGVAVLRHATAE
jgi:acyl-CoA synthetase (NDP forming)